jgi:Na+/proline symporter
VDSLLLDYLVIALYFALMIGAGYWGLRRARDAEDYLGAGGHLGPFMYVGTLSAVVLGGASTIGGVALGYENGISGMWLVFWMLMIADEQFSNLPIIYGMAVSLVVFMVVSLLTP